jgi:hypothetical protein
MEHVDLLSLLQELATCPYTESDAPSSGHLILIFEDQFEYPSI